MDLNISGIRDEDLNLALNNLSVLPKAEQIELAKLLELLDD